MEAILQGWLTKSPPEKKQFKLFGSKWRKRYFVLYAPPTVDGIPDAFTAILEYYSNKKLHHKCGTINLADCEEVLSSLDSEIYRYVFGLRTMHKNHLRTYYLAADTETEMNKWVNRLCHVLGLTENDDNLSPSSKLGLPSRLHTTQPMGIPGNARQTFQPRPLTHQSQPSLGPSSGGLMSPAPPPLRPVPSTPAAPFSRLNISEPNLLDPSKGYLENRRDVTDDGLRMMTSPPGTSRIASPPGAPSSLRSAGSIPELDRFSPTARKLGNFPGEGREFMELPPIPPEKTGPKVAVALDEPVLETSYDLPKQKYYERSEAEEQKLKNKLRETSDNDFYNSPSARYNTHCSDDNFYNSPPSRYNNTQLPTDDSYTMPPPHRYKSMGGDSGLGASEERIREDGRDWHGGAIRNSSEMTFTKLPDRKLPGDEFYNSPPTKRFTTQDSDECYNVPRPSTNWNQHQPGGGYWNEHQMDDRWNFCENLRPGLEDCYNVPKSSQNDKRKHISQGEEFYNIPKSHPENPGISYDLPRQKSNRRSHGGCVGIDRDRSGHFGSSYNPAEDYEVPKRGNLSRPASGQGDLGLYNIPGSHMFDTTGSDLHNRLNSFWENPECQLPFNGDRPIQAHVGTQGAPSGWKEGANDASEHRRLVATGPGANSSRVDFVSDSYHAPPLSSSSVSSVPASERRLPETNVSKQPVFVAGHPSSDQQTVNEGHRTELPSVAVSDFKSLTVVDDDSRFQGNAAEMKSSELKKSPSGAFRQNKSVQSSTSLHKKQGVAPGLPLHDSIRFTQRTKSFKRSIPSQDRSTLPLPVKRIVERSESSSSSSSDDESDQNSSTHSAKRS